MPRPWMRRAWKRLAQGARASLMYKECICRKGPFGIALRRKLLHVAFSRCWLHAHWGLFGMQRRAASLCSDALLLCKTLFSRRKRACGGRSESTEPAPSQHLASGFFALQCSLPAGKVLASPLLPTRWLPHRQGRFLVRQPAFPPLAGGPFLFRGLTSRGFLSRCSQETGKIFLL